MKKLLLFTLAVVMTLSLAACGDSATSSEAATASEITTTSETAPASEATTATEATTASEAVTLVDVTSETGINMKLPSDLTQTVVNDNSAFANKATGETVQFQKATFEGSDSFSSRTQEDIQESLKTKTNVVISSFDNNLKIDGKEALQYSFTYTSSKDAATTMAVTIVQIIDGSNLYVISFGYNNDNPGALAQNVQACIDSITITPAQ